MHFVTPYVGVWIEMILVALFVSRAIVTPYVGVWIEICHFDAFIRMAVVTPYVGVWIEIVRYPGVALVSRGHPLCGGVD